MDRTKEIIHKNVPHVSKKMSQGHNNMWFQIWRSWQFCLFGIVSR